MSGTADILSQRKIYGQIRFRLDDIDGILADDHAESIAQIDQRGIKGAAEAFRALPAPVLNTSRAGSALPPMPSGWTSRLG